MTTPATGAGRTVAIMQPYLFPYLGYFHLLAAADVFVFLDDVQFPKGGWTNRNRILAGAAPRWWTLALSGASPNRALCDIEIAGDGAKRALVGALAGAYARAPHFRETMAFVEPLLLDSEPRLARYAAAGVAAVAERHGLAPEIVFASAIDPTPQLRGQGRVIALARRLGAARYVNAPGGRALYDPRAFAAAGIELLFIEPNTEPCEQFSAPFVPSLSVVDAMMFLDPREIARRMRSFGLTA